MAFDAETDALCDLLAECHDDIALFNTAVLNKPPLWSGRPRGYDGQLEWAEALQRYRVVVAETANSLGKDMLIGSLAPWWLYTRVDSLVIATGPSQTLLGSVTFKEVRRAMEGCPFRKHFPEIFQVDISEGVKASPLTMTLAPGWGALAFSTTSIERASGQHAGNLLVVITEASAISAEIGSALDSLNATKMFLAMNPVRATGWAVDICDQGDRDARENVPPHLAVRHFVTPAMASPHAHLDRSPYGLADRSWIESMARKHGKNSLWYRVHVLAQRPRLDQDTLIPPEHLDACTSPEAAAAAAEARKAGRGGQKRISCDVGEGVGRARSVVFVRDDVGILECDASPYTGPSGAAAVIARLREKWGVAERDCSYDGAGTTGKRMSNALQAQGIYGAVPYLGGGAGGKRFTNLRTAAAMALARRLDPEHFLGEGVAWRPFHIPVQPWWPALREELLALRYSLKGDKSALEDKESMQERLGHAPDTCDALTQSFRDEAVRGD
ncbi:hypothetical protein [Aquisphaera insulae]|uniref:hypothetical protein n=1 Tax=Aquisphaera insulae TaxID=2712864 RepID=UPI0013EB8BD8|nr:hypothetical protein [Aquisphaera insulae]